MARRLLTLAAGLAVALTSLAVPAAQAAPPTPTATASAWHATTPFVNGRTSAGSARIGDRLYVVGGYSYDAVAEQLNIYNDVQFTRMRPGGGVGSWHTTTPFPTPRLGQGVFAHGNRLYVIGGGDGATSYYDDVQYAAVRPNGTIAPAGWQASPHRLVIPRAAFATGTYRFGGQTYAYVVGGVGNDENGNTVHYASMEYAPIHSDGSLGPWQLMDNEFNLTRSSLTAAWVDHCLYVVGGFGDRFEDIFGDVQYSCLTADGTLGPWTTSPNSMHNVRYGAVMYVVPRPALHAVEFIVVGGNNGGGVYLNQVESTLVVHGAAGNGPWTQAPESAWLPQPQWGQTGQLYRGKAYLLGGVTRSQEYLNQTLWATVRSLH